MLNPPDPLSSLSGYDWDPALSRRERNLWRLRQLAYAALTCGYVALGCVVVALGLTAVWLALR